MLQLPCLKPKRRFLARLHLAIQPRRHRQPQLAQHGGKHISQPHGVIHHTWRHAGPRQEERYLLGVVVHIQPMIKLVVLPETLPVVPHHHEQRGRISHRIHQALHLVIHKRQLPTVGVFFKALSIGNRRLIGRMGIKEVHPQEGRPIRVEPLQHA